ncbi:MAG TPA: GIY-YIG nuclease family protein, partial [Thermoanaerobaculia bacterium]
GVYLLTCPKTREQYVGSATGEEGFWGRWQNYLETGHGGNVGLQSRDMSDYQVSILEVAGTAATRDDILRMEGRWQSKLQSQEMGLNRNWARRS